MAPGYMAADDGTVGVRATMTEAGQAVSPATWTTDNVLKWSSAEKVMRGRKAKLLAEQVIALRNLHISLSVKVAR